MKKRVVITEYQKKVLVLFLHDDKCIKIRAVDSIHDTSDSVFLGRVDKVLKNIDASFVRCNKTSMYLKGTKYKPETVIPVMLKKETDVNKKDAITDEISLSGLFVIVNKCIDGIKFSSRIRDKSKICTDNLNNVIIRQNAVYANTESIYNEYKYLSKILDNIYKNKDKRTDNSILYLGLPELLNILFTEDICNYDEILTDSDEVFELINGFCNNYKYNNIDVNIRLKKYEDKMVPLAALISLSSKLERATNRIVHLKSDAYITIDKTEALTVIDVNSGNTTFKGDRATVIHSINIEAAKEVVLQLKLRNISGIIIVDFINEQKSEYNDELIKTIKEELKTDDQGAKCYGLTKLGLVEISRKRISKTLKEQLWI